MNSVAFWWSHWPYWMQGHWFDVKARCPLIFILHCPFQSLAFRLNVRPEMRMSLAWTSTRPPPLKMGQTSSLDWVFPLSPGSHRRRITLNLDGSDFTSLYLDLSKLIAFLPSMFVTLVHLKGLYNFSIIFHFHLGECSNKIENWRRAFLYEWTLLGFFTLVD